MNQSLLSSGQDLWETPQKFFNELNEEFHFTLDACATPENAKCRKIFHRRRQCTDAGLEWTCSFL